MVVRLRRLRKVRVATRLDEELGRAVSTEVSVAMRLYGELEFAISDQKPKRVAIRTSVESGVLVGFAGA